MGCTAKERKSNIDLLRFVCMLMVVSLHYFGWGGINHAEEAFRFNYLLTSGLSVFFRVAVNCFYMISGFFICKSNDEITPKYIGNAVFRQYKKIWIYSVLIFFAAIVGKIVKFSANGFLNALFPIMSNTWWFATIFLLLMCLRPFIGRVLTAANDRELAVLLVCVGFFDTIQAVMGSNAFGERGAGILHAAFMLMVGYAIKRWDGFKLSKLKALLLYFGSCLIAGVWAIVEKKVFGAEDAHVVYYNSPLIVAAAIGFFIFFLRVNCTWKWPSSIAPYVFAIYLINDHSMVREYAWQEILHCSSYYGSRLMILHWLSSVALFVTVGLVVDWLMEKLTSHIPISGRKNRV